MSEKPKHRCRDCRHFRPTGPYEGDNWGECRRLPPSLNPVFIQLAVKSDGKCDKLNGRVPTPSDDAMRHIGFPWAWGFPVINDDEWCGEFQEGDASTGGE